MTVAPNTSDICRYISMLFNMLQLSSLLALWSHKCILTFVWWLVQQAKLQDNACVHVCKSDKEETFAGKLMWVVVHPVLQAALWLSVAVCSACDRMLTLLLYALLA